MEAYRRCIDILIANKDGEKAEKETLVFNEYVDKFEHFYRDEISDTPIPPPPGNGSTPAADSTKDEQAEPAVPDGATE